MKIDWDFEKGLLAFMALLIVGGVGVIFWQRGIADELSSSQRTAEGQLALIGSTTREIHELRNAILEDEVAGGMRPFDFLEKQMVESLIGKKFGISSPRVVEPPDGGYVDKTYSLKPNQSKDEFDRRALAVFLIHIEAKTTLMKVTRLKLDVSTRRGATSDDWKPLIEVTERRALSSVSS